MTKTTGLQDACLQKLNELYADQRAIARDGGRSETNVMCAIYPQRGDSRDDRASLLGSMSWWARCQDLCSRQVFDQRIVTDLDGEDGYKKDGPWARPWTYRDLQAREAAAK